MNFLKRAFRSFLYHRANSFTMFLVFLIISVLVFSGLCISSGAEGSATEMRRNIGATVTVTNTNHSMSTLRGENTVDMDVVEKASMLPETDSSKLFAEGLAIPVNFKSIVSDEQVEKFTDWATLALYGNFDSSENSDFASGKAKLFNGRHINPDDVNACIMDYQTAVSAGFTLGSTVEITAFLPSNKGVKLGKTVSLELVGCYTTEEQSTTDNTPELNPENRIYTSPKLVTELNEINAVASAAFHITDPVDCDSFIEGFKALNGVSDGYSFLVDNSDYLVMRNSINSITGISNALVVASIVMGIIIVVLLVMNNMQGRKFEIGILLSIGEKRWKIIVQMLTEAVISMLVAVTVSIPIATFAAKIISGIIAVGSFDISINANTVLLVYFLGIVLTALAAIPSLVSVLKYRPKQIFMDME